MPKFVGIPVVGLDLKSEDSTIHIEVGTVIDSMVLRHPYEDVEVPGGEVVGIELTNRHCNGHHGPVFDGIPTHHFESDVMGNIKNAADYFKGYRIALKDEAGEVHVIPVDLIKEITGTFVDDDGTVTVVIDSVEDAQLALDNAGTGDTVVLAAGEYDVLYLRQSESQSEIVWTGHAGGALGKQTHGRLRTFEDLTIVADGEVIVNHIIVEGGKFSSSNAHSNSDAQPNLDSYINLKNVTIEGVTFKMTKDMSSFHPLSNGATAVDGLTFKNCRFIGSGNVENKTERALFWQQNVAEHKDLNGEVFHTSEWKNIVFDGCEGIDLYQFVELRHCENLKIVNCSFENTRGRDILLAAGENKFTGDIEISGNKSVGSTERFLRASGLAGNMVVSNNEIVGYAGADDDFIKVTLAEGGAVAGIGNTFDGEAVEFIDTCIYVPGKEPVAEETPAE